MDTPDASRSESASVAFAAIERLARPADLDGAVEIALAYPAARVFPTRVASTLGVCLKVGPSHRVTADGRQLDYPADSVCVRPPGCVWSSEPTGPAGFVSIDLATSLLPEPGLGAEGMVFLPRDELGDVARLAALLLSPVSRLEKDEAIAGLVAALCDVELLPGGIDGDAALAPRGLRRARAFLHASLEATPSLDDVAAAADMNRHVLIRQFRRRYGATPHAYLLRAKIDRARDLLAHGEPVAAVAASLQFADQAHFTRTFRSNVGLAPGEYRRRVRAVG